LAKKATISIVTQQCRLEEGDKETRAATATSEDAAAAASVADGRRRL
jgi:hypothetical protein